MAEKHSQTTQAARRILIIGYYGAGNTGDEAVLTAMLRDLRAARPGLAFTVPGENPDRLAAAHGVEAFLPNDMARLLDALERSDLVLLGGGGLLHDYWDPQPERLLTRDHWGLTYYCGIPWLAAQMGKPVMLYAVGVGPLLFESGRALVRDAALASAAITVRDPESARVLEELGVASPRPEVTADPVWRLDPAGAEELARLRRDAGIAAGDWLGVCVRNWNVGVNQSAWEDPLLQGIEPFARRRGLGILFLPFQDAPTPLQDDRGLARRLAARITSVPAAVVDRRCSPEELAGFVGSCRALVGMRLHSLLFACMGGVPAVALEYDPKVANLARMTQPPIAALPVSGLDAGALEGALEAAVERAEELGRAGRALAGALRARAARNTEVALELLDRPPVLTPRPRARRVWALARKGVSVEETLKAPAVEEAAPASPFVRIVALSFFDADGNDMFFGGAERYLIELARIVRAAGHPVEVLQRARPGRGWTRHYGDLRVTGVPSEDPFDLAEAIAEAGLPEPVLTIYLAFYLAARHRGGPAIGISHGVYWDDPYYHEDPAEEARHRERILRSIAKLEALVSVDTNTINWVRAAAPHLAERCLYLPNFVDTAEFHPTPRPPDGRIIVLYPRRLHPPRGFWLLAEIAPDLLARHPGVDLRLMGKANPPEGAAAENLAARFPGRVQWDALPPERMAEAYAESDIVLIPTISSEGTSLSCLEAQAAGRAVIATRVGGLPDLVVDGENGLLIDPNPSSLAAAIDRLVADPKLRHRLGERAREMAPRFAIERWRERWTCLLREFLPEPDARTRRLAGRTVPAAVFVPGGRANSRERLWAAARDFSRHGGDAYWIGEPPPGAGDPPPRLHRLGEADDLYLESPLVLIGHPQDVPPGERFDRPRITVAGPEIQDVCRDLIRPLLRSETRRGRDRGLPARSGEAGQRPPAPEAIGRDLVGQIRDAELDLLAERLEGEGEELLRLREERDRQEELQEEIAAKRKVFDALAAQLVELTQRLSARERELVSLARFTEENRREIENLRRANDEENARLAELAAELQAWKSSRVWKLAGLYWKARTLFRRRPQPAGAAGGEAPAPDTGAAAPIARPDLYDVVCLPIIRWDFRFQRPQQLMTQFAKAGHRVFYVIAHEFRLSGPPFQLFERAPNVYEVSMYGPTLSLYKDELDANARRYWADALDALRRDRSLGATVTVVQLPFWQPLAQELRHRLGWPIVYDLMDDHSGFTINRPRMVGQETELLRTADLVTATSALLEGKARARNRSVLLLRNAGDYDHFARAASPPVRKRRPVVGYYGAIADWFDADLMAELARRRPDWKFVLIGSTVQGGIQALKKLRNVSLLGERPYAEIPDWLKSFDVAVIPFKRLPLTEATNPVKAYEILSAGKPLVSVPLPEIVPLVPHVRLASSAEEFEREIEAALGEEDPGIAEGRQAFARENTWAKRFEVLAPAVRGIFPRASIVIVTFNNLELNRQCLEALYARTEWPNFEVIVVDNGSTDGTPEFLREAQGRYRDLKVILNSDNRGFARANNQGLKEASGDTLVLLNNDTAVSRGWLTALIGHLRRDPGLGLVGPVTNEIANEARVEVGYARLEDMPAWAEDFVRAHDGQSFEIPMLAMFCVAMRRELVEKVGLLDERFEVGMFEDDDYTRRVRAAGFDIRCAQDAFVHHVGRSSFKLLGEERYMEVFEKNRSLYEEKWGEAWKPHSRRRGGEDAASRLRDRLRVIAREEGEPEKAPVVFLPSIGWNTPLFQRPHHLALELARRGHPVFFDCTGSTIDPFEGFSRAAPRLWLYRGPDGVLDSLPRPILWAFPYNAPLVDRWKERVIVYDLIDDLSVFPYDPRTLEANHERMLKEADLVLAVARSLVAGISARRPDALYVPNGVEFERFSAPSPDVPLDRAFLRFADGNAPIAGYYGAIARWLDVGLLADTAALRPDWKFVVLGHRLADAPSLRSLEKRSNVLVLEAQPYSSLPAYLTRFTVATIPFKINPITLATSPLKLFEYFAAGRPVVTTPMPECAAFSEVRIAATPEEFARALDAARADGEDAGFRERLRSLGRENSWAARVQTVLDHLSSNAPGRAAALPRDPERMGRLEAPR